MLVGQLAIVDAALFAGAATYISHSEQPSRLKTDDRALLTEFKESYPRGTQMQAPLAAVGALLGLLQWLIYGGNLWFLGAIIIFSNWPFTYVVIMPLNKTLMSMPSNSGNAESRKLIQKWGTVSFGSCWTWISVYFSFSVSVVVLGVSRANFIFVLY